MAVHRRFSVAKPKAKKTKPVLVQATPLREEPPQINSLDDLNRLHKHDMDMRRSSRADAIASAVGLSRNATFADVVRSDFFRFLLDGPRDIDAECGYPSWLTPDHYRTMYDREGIAARVVNCEPEETWGVDPDVYEDEDETTDTPFESAWDDLLKKFNIWHFLQRIDTLSGIGQYGILLLGINDGKSLQEPVDGINEDGTGESGNEHELLYLRPFSEEVVFVKTREVDIGNPRYGQPTMYTIQFKDFPNWGIQAGEIIARDVHWTRVIHVADNRKQSEVYGVPRMQNVWNRLYDLRKIYSSSGEAFWKGGFPGMAFEMDPEVAAQGNELDKEGLRKEMQAYQAGLQRYIAVTGLTTKTLAPSITEPTATAECHLKAIAISKGVPYRVLFGSEEAKLAGEQDNRGWNKKLKKRQDKYVTPMLIRPFVDRMIAFGVLPEPEEYSIDWPDLNSPTDQDKAAVALSRTQAMQAYVQGGVDSLIPPLPYLVQILGFTTEEAETILEQAQEHLDEVQDDVESQADDINSQQDNGTMDEGAIGDEQQPNQGNALDQGNLSGKTTIGKKGKAVAAQIVQQPSLNAMYRVIRKRRAA